jgi:hypothetical protein
MITALFTKTIAIDATPYEKAEDKLQEHVHMGNGQPDRMHFPFNSDPNWQMCRKSQTLPPGNAV